MAAPTARRANVHRFPEFIRWAERHFGVLRTHIALHATMLPDPVRASVASLDRRLSGLLGKCTSGPNLSARELGLVFQLAQTTVAAIQELGSEVPEYTALKEDVHRLAIAYHPTTLDECWEVRLYLQNQILKRGSDLETIADDMDLKLALPYFLVDQELLAGIEGITDWAKARLWEEGIGDLASELAGSAQSASQNPANQPGGGVPAQPNPSQSGPIWDQESTLTPSGVAPPASRRQGSRLQSRFVLLSAGTVRESGGPYDLNVAITSAVTSFTKAVLAAGGRIVSAGHPSLSETMTEAAAEIVQIGNPTPEHSPMHIYFSHGFEIPAGATAKDLKFACDQGLATISWSPVPEDDRSAAASLMLLRTTMMRDTQPVAMVAIGGAEGVIDECQIFHQYFPTAPIFVFETTGGAAAILAKQDLTRVLVLDREFYRRFQGVKFAGFKPDEHPYALMMDLLIAEIVALWEAES
jgi:hypothetical protein